MRNSWQTWPVDLKWNILLHWGDENRSVWSDWWFFLKTTKRKIKDIVFYLVLQSYYLSNSYVWKLEFNANCIFYILSRLHVCRLPWFTWPSPPPFGWGRICYTEKKERKKGGVVSPSAQECGVSELTSGHPAHYLTQQDALMMGET